MSNVYPLAPIALFVYNRPKHTQLTINALLANPEASESIIYIFSDGAKDEFDVNLVQEVRDYISNLEGFAEVRIIEQAENIGLAQSIISGVTQILYSHEKIIVLEDDLITSKHFLNYMNQALNLYKRVPNIGCITGYMYPISKSKQGESVLLDFPSSWGWGTWNYAWSIFNSDGEFLLSTLKKHKLLTKFDLCGPGSYKKMLKDQVSGKNNSWFIRWHASLFLVGKLTVSPTVSLVQNIGLDGTGVHCNKWKFNPLKTVVSDVQVNVKNDLSKDISKNKKLIKKFHKKLFFYRCVNAAYRMCSKLFNSNN